MKVSFLVERFDPRKDTTPYFKDYAIDIDEGSTVLEGLFNIMEGVDGSLSFRRSCRSAICGSCAMRINGRERLACNTQILPQLNTGGEIRIQPLRNLAVIKDLIVDMDPFWNKVTSITPWIQPKPDLSSGEIKMPKDVIANFHNVDACIMCSACVSSCTSLEVSKGFTGPAALAKSYRFMADPREAKKDLRLTDLCKDNGIWDCARCNSCVEVCPKDVKPMEAIVRLRKAAIEAGHTDSVGAKHITCFIDIVKHEGRLNEAQMPLKMMKGNVGGLMKILPLGLKMFLRGKVPPFFTKPIKGIDQVRRLFNERGW